MGSQSKCKKEEEVDPDDFEPDIEEYVDESWQIVT